jgi:hypothetical protein
MTGENVVPPNVNAGMKNPYWASCDWGSDGVNYEFRVKENLRGQLVFKLNNQGKEKMFCFFILPEFLDSFITGTILSRIFVLDRLSSLKLPLKRNELIFIDLELLA